MWRLNNTLLKNQWINEEIKEELRRYIRDFPGGTVVKNPAANAGDTGSTPGPGSFHMPRSN